MAGSALLLLVRVVALWAWAFCFAAVEIEIEGAYGWAERLPTWYRVTGPLGGPWSRLQGGRPLTGYHLFMFPIPLVAFHLGFAFGLSWSPAAEALVLSTYVAWAITWDLLWFVLNPAYGLSRFRQGTVWWYPGRWFGPFPADYAIALAISVALALVGAALGAGVEGLATQAATLCGFAVLTSLAVVAAPAYRRWYAWMRRAGSDDRPRVTIEAPPGERAPGTPGADRP